MTKRRHGDEEENGRPIWEEFELDIIECAICADIYQSPKQLPTCQHSFCEGCLHALAKDCYSGQAMPCPLCREPWTITIDKTADLEISEKLENLIFACKSADCADCLRVCRWCKTGTHITVLLRGMCRQIVWRMCQRTPQAAGD